jgi:hypothetical protein
MPAISQPAAQSPTEFTAATNTASVDHDAGSTDHRTSDLTRPQTTAHQKAVHQQLNRTARIAVSTAVPDSTKLPNDNPVWINARSTPPLFLLGIHQVPESGHRMERDQIRIVRCARPCVA